MNLLSYGILIVCELFLSVVCIVACVKVIFTLKSLIVENRKFYKYFAFLLLIIVLVIMNTVFEQLYEVYDVQVFKISTYADVVLTACLSLWSIVVCSEYQENLKQYKNLIEYREHSKKANKGN